ncbi:uncharacterized protein VTP21DRAFT_5169 [Calcarisporiella thermophila]|uniref:uncharacterized protein n=1 Tax=Calcarisporiella thermophila TaxID=911321 RepID=UPI0037430068
MYSTRNIRYLRIGEKQVLQMVLYLKEENVAWFNDHIMQQVLSAIQPVISKKFSEEDKKKGKDTVADVFRGADFQFAYYFKPTDTRHCILMKDISFTAPERNAASDNEEDIEEDVKLKLKATYDNLALHRKTLVVVVEPYSPQRPPPDFMGFEYRRELSIQNYFTAKSSSNAGDAD